MALEPDFEGRAAAAWQAAAAELDRAARPGALDLGHPAWAAATAHVAAAAAVYVELLPALAELHRHVAGRALAEYDPDLATHAADLERAQQVVRNTLAHLHEVPLAWSAGTTPAAAEEMVWQLARATGIRYCAAPAALVERPSPIALFELAAALGVVAAVFERLDPEAAPTRSTLWALPTATPSLAGVGRSVIGATLALADALRGRVPAA
ncbi:MAG: hypothetical protein EXR79_08555 [Myxococcales bacterium]|nr:hypothetical protein [Myxococcales bacterium]